MLTIENRHYSQFISEKKLTFQKKTLTTNIFQYAVKEVEKKVKCLHLHLSPIGGEIYVT